MLNRYVGRALRKLNGAFVFADEGLIKLHAVTGSYTLS